MNTLPIGATIGILGGGQLGRMLAMAAAQIGYRVHIYAPEDVSCAAEVAAEMTRAAYEDQAALEQFARSVDVLTYEFENVPVSALAAIQAKTRLFPPLKALEVTQDRATEKRFAESLNIATAPWAEVNDHASLDQAIQKIGTPALLKTRQMGYDGKGQARINSPAEAEAAWGTLAGQACILEGLVKFSHEFSLIAVRGQDGSCVFYDPPENIHREGILRTSIVPASDAVLQHLLQARAITRRIGEALGYVGVFAVEFFATPNTPVFNEMAPRVHNSGHWTIEGAEISQFENHIRAICGLPLGATGLAGKQVKMTNLIGTEAVDLPRLITERHAHVHLYGKGEARAGRKMGHITTVVR